GSLKTSSSRQVKESKYRQSAIPRRTRKDRQTGTRLEGLRSFGPGTAFNQTTSPFGFTANGNIRGTAGDRSKRPNSRTTSCRHCYFARRCLSLVGSLRL